MLFATQKNLYTLSIDGLICRVSIFRQDDHSSMTIERHIFLRKLKKIVSNSQFCNWSE